MRRLEINNNCIQEYNKLTEINIKQIRLLNSFEYTEVERELSKRADNERCVFLFKMYKKVFCDLKTSYNLTKMNVWKKKFVSIRNCELMFLFGGKVQLF